MACEPVSALAEKAKGGLVPEPQKGIAFHTSQEGKGSRTACSLVREIVVTGSIRMGAACRIKDASFNPLLKWTPLVKRVVGYVRPMDQGEGPDELLGHATWEIDDLVMPEISIKTTVGRTVGIAIQQGENLGDQENGFASKEAPMHRHGR
jgi:hypothetical protein